MNLKMLGSGSKGNCYVLECSDFTGLIECGLPFKEILKKIYVENLSFTDIDFCFVSHEHKDHSKAIKEIAEKAIPIFLSEGTKNFLNLPNRWNINLVKSFVPVSFSPKIQFNFFPLVHDALEPLGLVIDYPEGRFLYITDTAYVPYRFKNITHLAIECNYCEELLLNSNLTASIRKRILKTHLGLNGLLIFLKRNDLSKLQHIWVLHLSDAHSDKKKILAEVGGIVSTKTKITIG